MEFLKVNTSVLKLMLRSRNKTEIKPFIDYMYNHFDKEDLKQLPPFMEKKGSLSQATKEQYITLIVNLSTNRYFQEVFANALSKNEVSQKLHAELIWNDYHISTEEFCQSVDYKLKLPTMSDAKWANEIKSLEGENAFVVRHINRYREKDILYVPDKYSEILKFFYPVPDDYNLVAQKELKKCKFHYSNEREILPFAKTISEMLSSNLIAFGKSNEKPLAKSFKIVKQSTSINEFYDEKGMDSLVTDILIRSFKYSDYNPKKSEANNLKNLIDFQFRDRVSFSIIRIFAMHLKRIKYDSTEYQQRGLFTLVREMIHNMPKDEWVSFENILSYTYYRESYFHFGSKHERENYQFVYGELGDEYEEYDYYGKGKIDVGYAHGELFHEPILKAVFFYLGALGLMELKYDDPISPHEITADGEDYISVWDGLKYVKLTELGNYIFGFSKSYTPKEQIVVKPISKMKFDEFKPIITVSKEDVIAIAQLEPFVDKLDNNRYILSYTKLFKDCDNLKALKLKIDSFYTKIEKNPPKIFTEFFDKALKNSNLMKRNLKQIVIELQDNRELLNLFMTNRKLQELIIKAEGYRIIVLKTDISKVTKIVKDNGFFVEF